MSDDCLVFLGDTLWDKSAARYIVTITDNALTLQLGGSAILTLMWRDSQIQTVLAERRLICTDV